MALSATSLYYLRVDQLRAECAERGLSCGVADCARHVLFLYTMNLQLFRLRYDTYDQYVYAVRSNRVPPAALPPPQAPRICVTFLSGIDTQSRCHRDCLSAGGARPWVNDAEV